jgi:para-nitrobenzyl esterase
MNSAANYAAQLSVAQANGQRFQGWDVIPDDNFILCYFCDWSSDIPVIRQASLARLSAISRRAWARTIGTRSRSTTTSQRSSEIRNAMTALFRSSFPRKKVQDGLVLSSSPLSLVAKSKAGKAPVYHYLFACEYPVNGGIPSFHCSEIAFVFHNLSEPQIRIATGDAPEGYALQDRVCRAWVNFARTGNPSQPGLDWNPFSPADMQTMVFDTA